MSDELLPMTVDDALKEADKLFSTRRATCAAVLAAEVRRLRAAVEAVRALPTYDAELGGYTEGGPFVYRDDVLRILEASDGD